MKKMLFITLATIPYQGMKAQQTPLTIPQESEIEDPFACLDDHRNIPDIHTLMKTEEEIKDFTIYKMNWFEKFWVNIGYAVYEKYTNVQMYCARVITAMKQKYFSKPQEPVKVDEQQQQQEQ